MELEYGAGQAEAVLDITTGKVVMYNAPAPESREVSDLHDRYGGRQYYRSHSGLSGAGFVPSSITLRRCGVLRVDVARPRLPWQGETLPDMRLVVPTRHLQRDEDAPLIVVRGHDVYFVPDWALPEFLRGEWTPGHTHEVALTSWYCLEFPGSVHPPQWMADEPRELEVVVHRHNYPKFGRLGLRRVLELLFWEQLYSPGAIGYQARNAWYKGLGLEVAIDGEVYHAAGGILRRKADVSREALQRACPWVRFLDPPEGGVNSSTYVAEDGESRSFALVDFDEGKFLLSNEEAATMLASGKLTPEVNRLIQEAGEKRFAAEEGGDKQ